VKKAILALGILALLTVPANAGPMILKVGPVQMQAINYDMGTIYTGDSYTADGEAAVDALPQIPCPYAYEWDDANGHHREDSWAILKVIAIHYDGFPQAYWQDNPNEEITGIFYGLVDIYADKPTTGDDTEVLSYGGKIDLYYDTNPATFLDPSQGPAARDLSEPAKYPTATEGTRLVTMDFADGSFNTFMGPSASTLLQADFHGEYDFGTLFGNGEAFADVVPGSGVWAEGLDNQFLMWPGLEHYPAVSGPPWTYRDESVDFRLQWDTVPDTIYNEWTVISSDPIRTSFVPEPTTMGLVGLGLLALVKRRRRSK